MHLHEAAQALHAAAVGADVAITAVSTDTRNLPAGCLFVALKGPRFDGHKFAAKALEQGAAAVMVAADAQMTISPAIVVKDTLQALGRLAAWHRGQMPAKVAAITGSNGKTTVKEMLAAILAVEVGAEAAEDCVLATAGNLNNDIGMPLTLLKLTPQHRYAAIEMGMNHAGEIAYLTQIARPDVALVNNALRAHLEGLGSVEAVARAKGEIYAGLKEGGIAIVNADDPHATLWRGLACPRKVISFGFSENANVRILPGSRTVAGAAAPRQRDSSGEALQLTLDTPQGRIETTLQVPGEHNLRNAAAAASLALALGIGVESIASGLADYTGVKGRLQSHACILGATLIDDTYNANPDSVLAAIQVLAARPGTRILVLGDMGELGPDAANLHSEVGERARAAGIDRLLCLGEMTLHTVEAFGTNGMHFERIEELLAEIECALADEQPPRSENHLAAPRGGAMPALGRPGGGPVTVLVKGSRFMQMERIVKSFMEADKCS
ncbi:MAG: UDP-N-acetylmuramoyl-tripeptide--D-alanyl-D-alanine ligase [Pseudomonadota bacterium]|nr:UDP-N-acetylmuramoyl-tripeptide--D-alanyl-D-alanine ligase [Pseudomonadota bacterium]